jgi:hypothetical protein
MRKLLLVIITLTGLWGGRTQADEGMWLPYLINQNMEEMQKLGLKLDADALYNVNQSSLKDAIVRLGSGFCTGEIISGQGLLLTNHHCGYSVIQAKSSTENDYLKNGFWAMKKEEELPAGFSVSFLVKIEDVTESMLEGVTDEMSEMDRARAIGANASKVSNTLKGDTDYEINVKEFYSGNQYLAYVYEVYEDVRLVGAPPSSIGKFGGDTDNWMWPRHTGDFTLFRVYAGPDNKPAAYSPDNQPLKPKHHLPVSIKGVKKDDFAMIWGFPGSTDRYLTSWGVELATEKDQPSRVKIRRQKLDIYEKYMNQSDAVRIQYASKHARVSNYWKYFIGQTAGLKRLNVYAKKQAQEKAFVNWVNQNDQRKEKYGEVMNLYKDAYADLNQKELASTYFIEAIAGIEIIRYGFNFVRLKSTVEALEKAKKEGKEEEIKALEGRLQSQIDALKAEAPTYFKDYYKPIDQKVFAEMIRIYEEDLPSNLKPEEYNNMVKKYKGNYEKFASKLFKKSILDDEDKLMAWLESPKYKLLDKDPAIKMSEIFLNWYRSELAVDLAPANTKRDKADRLYKAGMMEMNPSKKFYPNANSTMRFTYGQVLDYEARDAVHYDLVTTARGIVEKYQPGDHEFDVPKKLLDLIEAKDYGRYGKDGELVVCFLSNNDITGGNSGSPVINGKGELIGTAFDGNWEAMSGDIAFEPELQRTISVDIRYTLFIIDKYAGAGHLVEEMTIVE